MEERREDRSGASAHDARRHAVRTRALEDFLSTLLLSRRNREIRVRCCVPGKHRLLNFAPLDLFFFFLSTMRVFFRMILLGERDNSDKRKVTE